MFFVWISVHYNCTLILNYLLFFLFFIILYLFIYFLVIYFLIIWIFVAENSIWMIVVYTTSSTPYANFIVAYFYSYMRVHACCLFVYSFYFILNVIFSLLFCYFSSQFYFKLVVNLCKRTGKLHRLWWIN